MGEDGEQDAIHAGFVLECARGPGPSADLSEAPLDGICGAHGAALGLGRGEDALQATDGLLAAAPDDPQSLLLRASALVATKRLDEAEATYRRLKDISTRDADDTPRWCLALAGFLLEQRQDKERAAARTTAAELTRELSEAQKLVGSAELRARGLEDALADTRQRLDEATNAATRAERASAAAEARAALLESAHAAELQRLREAHSAELQRFAARKPELTRQRRSSGAG